MGQRRVELVTFDIVKDLVSIHQPLPRIIACLLKGASTHGLSIEQLLSLQPEVSACAYIYVNFFRTFPASTGHAYTSVPRGALLTSCCDGDTSDGRYVEA